MNQYRQGDVYIIQIKKVPNGGDPVARQSGRLVLAYGEVTGHSHAIMDDGAVLLNLGAQRFLEVATPVRLYHEEHDEIRLPAGSYEVIIQREYSPEAIRTVTD